VILIPTIACGLAAWAAGIETRGYDYDEVMRAHSIWLVAEGLVPYRNFLECHPPYFAMLTPLIRIDPHDPCAFLWWLRMLSAAGNLLFLCGLAVLGASAMGSGRLPALFGLAVVAVHPAILEYLVEFRIDGWAYAIAAWSIYRFRGLGREAYRSFEFGVLTGIASLLFCPKLALLPPLIVLFEQFAARQSLRGGVRALVAYIAGTGVAGGLFAAYLTWHGIDWDRTFQAVVRYNALSNANLSFRFSLLQKIVKIRVLPWVILAGLAAWLVAQARNRSRPDAYAMALAVWLVMQGLVVAYPYKQYYAPWFLFASGFVGYLWRSLRDVLGRARVVVVLIACALTVLADIRAARQWADAGDAKMQQLLVRRMNSLTRPEDRVVASPPLHPIDRRDSFFIWFNNFDPRGLDTERVLARLPAFQGYVAAGRFRQELEDQPPALVVLSGDWRIVPYTPGQQEALNDFLDRYGYQTVAVERARFALRPDRFEDARRHRLLYGDLGRLAAPPG
jgi:hypothetical protein